MCHIPPLDDGKAQPLGFTFIGELRLDGFGSPEPDFLKWMEASLFVDLAIASDEMTWHKHSAKTRDAWGLFHAASEATSKLLDLYKCNPRLFQKIARQLSFLPCFTSWHPDAKRFNRQLLEFSQLGLISVYGDLRKNARHVVRQSWPVRYGECSMIAPSDVLVIIRAHGRGVHKFPIDRIRHAGMIVNAPGMEFDGERETIITHG